MISVLLILAAAGGPTLDQKIASVLPTPAEDKFLKIPWRQDLMAARLESQQTGKPIFLWLMNGDPLGGT